MAHMVAGPGSCVETGRRSPPTQQIPDVFSVGSARDESRRGCTDGKTELSVGCEDKCSHCVRADWGPERGGCHAAQGKHFQRERQDGEQ